MWDSMRIGELAARLGLNPKTIRDYEGIGLLPPSDRSESGYHLYGERDAGRLAFIQRAKVLGLTLDETHDLLSLSVFGDQPCQRVLSLIDAKIAEVERRTTELQAFRSGLTNLCADWTDWAALSEDAKEQTTVSARS